MTHSSGNTGHDHQHTRIMEITLYGQKLLVADKVYQFFHRAKEVLLLIAEATGHTNAKDIAIAAREFMNANPGTGMAFHVNGEQKVFHEKEIKPALAIALGGRVIFQYDEKHAYVANFNVDWDVIDKA